MPERQASNTAIITAVLRAAHQILDAHPKILDDPVAIGLVEGSSTADIRTQESDLQQPLKRLARSLFVMRSRFAEDQLAEAVQAGVRQYVLLGAGLDTFAYRQPAWARPLQIIEVDQPASQAFKRERLGHAGVAIPDNVTFCPLDFERTSLQEGLGAVAFDPQVPTFFVWLGVTQYLTSEAIAATLQLCSPCRPPAALPSRSSCLMPSSRETTCRPPRSIRPSPRPTANPGSRASSRSPCVSGCWHWGFRPSSISRQRWPPCGISRGATMDCLRRGSSS